MDLFFEQLPIVLGALNTGFIQTLKLFFVTLLGAFPLGLLIAFGSMSKFKPLSYLMKFIVWIVRGTPLMIQIIFRDLYSITRSGAVAKAEDSWQHRYRSS